MPLKRAHMLKHISEYVTQELLNVVGATPRKPPQSQLGRSTTRPQVCQLELPRAESRKRSPRIASILAPRFPCRLPSFPA